MLEKVKIALRLTTTAFDGEINDLIAAALADLRVSAGVSIPGTPENDPLILRAVITFCRANFGMPPDYDQLKAAYDEQKAQLQMATGYGLPESVADDE